MNTGADHHSDHNDWPSRCHSAFSGAFWPTGCKWRKPRFESEMDSSICKGLENTWEQEWRQAGPNVEAFIFSGESEFEEFELLGFLQQPRLHASLSWFPLDFYYCYFIWAKTMFQAWICSHIVHWPAEIKPTQTEWCTNKVLNTGDHWWNKDLLREKLTKEKVNTAADLKRGEEEMVQ